MASQRRGGLQEAMSTFSSLLKYRRGKAPGDAQKKARVDFPRQVSQSSFKLRNPSQAIPQSGKHFIIGIATYSASELSLLDQLEESLGSSKSETLDVEVFDVLDCKKMSDFQRFIPGIGGVHRTPVIGVISDGKLIDHATGLSDVTNALRRFNVLNHS